MLAPRPSYTRTCAGREKWDCYPNIHACTELYLLFFLFNSVPLYSVSLSVSDMKTTVSVRSNSENRNDGAI